MNFKEWNEIAELVGIAAVVGSLIFVGLQMKQAQEIANAERRMMRVANQIEMNNAINENPDVWARGLSGEELSTSEAVIFENLLTNFSNFVHFNWHAAQDTRSGPGATSTVADFSVFLYENPGARRVWESRQEWFENNKSLLIPGVDIAEDYEHLVFGHLNKLDRLQE